MATTGYLNARAMAARARVLLLRISRSARKENAIRSDFYVQMWSRAAENLGAEVVESYGEVLTIARDGLEAKVFRNYTDLDGPVTLRAVGTKPFVHAALGAHDISTPKYETFSLKRRDIAFDFLHAHGCCVVKPASGTGAGAGVTTGITTRRELVNAAIVAAGHGEELLIEQQVSGSNLRLLYLDGRLLDAVERRPPTVVGDGKSTIAQLVRATNQDRLIRGSLAAQVLLRYDLDMKRTLSAHGTGWRKVLEKDSVVQLKTVINDNAAVDNVSICDVIAPEIVEVGRQAARVLDVRLAGVDVVTPDFTKDLESAGGVVLEVNTTPGLFIHEANQPLQVAVAILEACLTKPQGSHMSPALSVAGRGN